LPTALITGVTGQDGSYLSELLLEKGYDVHGIVRRSSNFNTQRIDHIRDKLTLHFGDILDGAALMRLFWEVQPDEVYNLAAQSHVKVSFEIPALTAQVNAMGTLNVLEAARAMKRPPRVYQASTSEMFGNAPHPQSETTPFSPESPYACAKVYAHQLCVNYRNSYRLPVSCGILFNHESPRRGETFVTRKITRAVGRIKAGLQESLSLGNLDAIRDWGHAKDYVRAMWMMLQAEPDDYVIATGKSWTVQMFADKAFEYGRLDQSSRYIQQDAKYLRPSEVNYLQGDASKAYKKLGWEPEYAITELIHEMVTADIDLAKIERSVLNCSS
jgi:GDPmannose 4,6-dehydratase